MKRDPAEAAHAFRRRPLGRRPMPDHTARVSVTNATLRSTLGLRVMYATLRIGAAAVAALKPKPVVDVAHRGNRLQLAGLPLLASRWRVLRELDSEGAFAQLLCVEDTYSRKLQPGEWQEEQFQQHRDVYACKVVHRQYNAIGRREVTRLQSLALQNRWRASGRAPVLRFHSSFLFYGHVCIVTELLGDDMQGLLRDAWSSRAPPTSLAQLQGPRSRATTFPALRAAARQLLAALLFLKQANTVHGDIKPANICMRRPHPPVLDERRRRGSASASASAAANAPLSRLEFLLVGADDAPRPLELTLIDFGNAFLLSEVNMLGYGTACTVVQSLRYRAPEIVFELPGDTPSNPSSASKWFAPPIDMWSVGCTLAAMRTGRSLFCKCDTAEELAAQIVAMFGPMPFDVYGKARKFNTFVKNKNGQSQSPKVEEGEVEEEGNGTDEEESEEVEWVSDGGEARRQQRQRQRQRRRGKRDNGTSATRAKTISPQKQKKGTFAEDRDQDRARWGSEVGDAQQFSSLVRGMLNVDPAKRLTPAQALRHPFFDAAFPFAMLREAEKQEEEDAEEQTLAASGWAAAAASPLPGMCGFAASPLTTMSAQKRPIAAQAAASALATTESSLIAAASASRATSSASHWSPSWTRVTVSKKKKREHDEESANGMPPSLLQPALFVHGGGSGSGNKSGGDGSKREMRERESESSAASSSSPSSLLAAASSSGERHAPKRRKVAPNPSVAAHTSSLLDIFR